ncbi:glucose-6-phosphate dehydrogenase assembly protein OpcA [Nakamurella lactea]|uniref:glucose-6-phosphate dehydrogenase assembly protein OpcA n=1 Tax=Nakamurella lactea TaxID=459515 RepID=UPI00040E277E|nr:glucose-6-phosphate dehydrogenase assembly protein OpcA [Nakamurella lactea]
MIIDLPSTTSATINKTMVTLREKGGTVTLGRVLTLVIVTDESDSEAPIAAANAASFEHPCRVIVVAGGTRRGTARMDAQIRVGGDAGASEVIVLRLFGAMTDQGASVVIPLLLADAPVVAWWPGVAPENPADDPIGALAQRRITDAASSRRPLAAITQRREVYRPGDTDIAWTRLTNWRGVLAAALDEPPHEKVNSAVVAGASDSASADLMAGWLALRLGCPVQRTVKGRAGSGMYSVVLNRRSGEIRLERPDQRTANLMMENGPERSLALLRRSLRDCLAEELRRLDADDVYAEVLTKGLPSVAAGAAKSGIAKSGTAKSGTAKSSTAKKSAPPAKRATPNRKRVTK